MAIIKFRAMDKMIIALGETSAIITQMIKDTVGNPAAAEFKFAFVDTDKKTLDKIRTDDKNKIFISNKSSVFPPSCFNNIIDIFIMVALGGKVGQIYTLPIIKSAIDSGIKNINIIAILPFSFEGEKRILRAFDVLERIRSMGVNHIETINNDTILKDVTTFKADLTYTEKMQHFNKLIAEKLINLSINI
ncbi:MAG: hypothetical protein NC453_19030 [Muribaculum sp.]|nr:hypothetical protein [Muribaculum sp.]